MKLPESGAIYLIIEWGIPRGTQTTQSVVIAIGCSSYPVGKTLSLKTAYTLVVGHREIRLELNMKFSP